MATKNIKSMMMKSLKYFTFFKNTEKVPDSMELLELPMSLQYNESQSAIRNATCQVCKNIVINPKMCGSCEVLYCGNCASSLIIDQKTEGSTTCVNPQCQKDLNLLPLSKSQKRILDDFHMECPSGNKDCPPPIPYKNILSHLKECDYWLGFSKCTGCGLVDKKEIIDEHVEKCPFTFFKCDACGTTIKRKDLELHHDTCKKINPDCDMCTDLKIRVANIEERLLDKIDALVAGEDKLKNKISSLENIIDFQTKSNFYN